MDGYLCFKLHRAVYLHFTSDYDVFQYNGKAVGISEEHYAKCSYKGIFELVSRYMNTPKDVIDYYVASMIYTATDQSFNNAIAMDLYTMYKKDKEAATHRISSDIYNLCLPNDVKASPTPSKLLTGTIARKYSPMTIVALNRQFNFLQSWKDRDYFGLTPYINRWIKFDKFVHYNKDKVAEAISESSLLLVP